MNTPSEVTDTTAFLLYQRTTLFDEFVNGSHCVIASSPEQLKIFARLHDWEIQDLPLCRDHNVLVIRKENDSNPQCWVKWHYSGYRAAFSRFLDLHYPQYQNVLTSDVHVDHLQPRYRFKKGMEYYVRLNLTPKNVNAAFGAGFERSFYEWERDRSLNPAIHMCWLTFCKVHGILPPSKIAGIDHWKMWARANAKNFADRSGEHGGLAYMGLLNVLRLGYTKYYSGAPEQITMEEMLAEYENGRDQIEE
jgi:hypothetical protein